MNYSSVKQIALSSLLILLYIVTYYVFTALLNPIPARGDSFDYHIPIAQTILDGRFLHPYHFKLPQWYYPGTAEVVNSFFMLFHIPLTFTNILATIIMFYFCFQLGRLYKLSFYMALLFAIAFTSTTAVTRWLNAVNVDVWMGVFFMWILLLLENPKKTLGFAAQSGFLIGLFIGSKYTSILLMIPLLIFYSKKLVCIFDMGRFVIFVLTFFLSGGFWYVRNYIFTGNPFYPISVLWFRGIDVFGGLTIANVSITHPIDMVNAGFGEYKLWILSGIAAFGYLIYELIIQRKRTFDPIQRLFIIGVLNSIIFLSFPTSNHPWVMVSSFRYSYPVFIPFMLGIFLIAERHKKQELIGYFTIANMIDVLSMVFYPKLIFFYLPAFFLIIYLLNRYE